MASANDPALPARLPAWAKRIDWWQAATGIFVLTVFMGGHYFSGGVRVYASQFVMMTIICELCMIWAAIGAAATSGLLPAIGPNPARSSFVETVPGWML